MNRTLRILHLEDNLMDAELIKTILKKEAAGCEIVCVQTRNDFQRALEESTYDLILSDFSGPDFDGMSSLSLCRKKYPETPFIFVSGSIGEDAAIDSLFGGATDYVLKQRLKRLGPAVARAFREAKERKERKVLEEKYLQAQKMEVVGQLAGGIAHDFNNLLAVILGHLELLLIRKNADPKLMDSLKDIHLAAESAGNLTQQLLLLSRKQSLQTMMTMDLNRTIGVMTKLLGRVIGGKIKLRAACATETMPVKADSGMLEQVIMNLVVNARDAMPGGGEIVIKSERIEIEERHAGIEGRQAGKFICLTVSDTGAGIPPEVLSRMFDPFFTTKEPGKGTGLGLATVYGIVRQHLGWIEVKSQVGAGSEFRVFLPESGEPLPAESPNLGISGPGGKETILIVESDNRSRKQVKIYLEEQGYEILDAATGAEALAISGPPANRIDLLITGVMMPDGMPGMDLADRLRRKKPGLKVILTSRYGLDPYGQDSPSPSNGFFLQMPYERNSLIQTVRQCLDFKQPIQPSY